MKRTARVVRWYTAFAATLSCIALTIAAHEQTAIRQAGAHVPGQRWLHGVIESSRDRGAALLRERELLDRATGSAIDRYERERRHSLRLISAVRDEALRRSHRLLVHGGGA